MPSTSAIALVVAGGATAALFALERLCDPTDERWRLPIRRRRSYTPEKLLRHEPEIQRRLRLATG